MGRVRTLLARDQAAFITVAVAMGFIFAISFGLL